MKRRTIYEMGKKEVNKLWATIIKKKEKQNYFSRVRQKRAKIQLCTLIYVEMISLSAAAALAWQQTCRIGGSLW